MSANLVDVDAFTSPVVVPTDGDALTAASVLQGFQPLANRTRNLDNRVGGLAISAGNWVVGGSLFAQNAKYDLTTVGVILGSDLSLSGGNTVIIATAGVYQITWGTTLEGGDAAAGLELGSYLDRNGSNIQFATMHRGRADVNDTVFVGGGFVLVASAADAISLKALFAIAGLTTVPTGHLGIVRLK